jgi:hypothetical protein
MTNSNDAGSRTVVWIVAAALSRESGFGHMMDVLRRRSQPYVLVHKKPHCPEMTIIHAKGVDVSGGLDGIRGPVVTIGTVSMRSGSLARGWSPGYVDCPDQSECMRHWGEAMLNHDAHRVALGDIGKPDVAVFVRPDGGDKPFTGRIVEPGSFDPWRAGLIEGSDGPAVAPLLPVLVSSPKTIWSEYRMVMVEGRYVTGSRYRTAGRIEHSPEVGARMIRFAEDLAAKWDPAPAYALDLADTPEGIKVVETNPISSAGFYCMDMKRFVEAMSEMAMRIGR